GTWNHCSATTVQRIRLGLQEALDDSAGTPVAWEWPRTAGHPMCSWEVPVTSGPGDAPFPVTVSGREQVIAALKAAFLQGRLPKDEFELRVGQALAIYAELDTLTADIPAAV